MASNLMPLMGVSTCDGIPQQNRNDDVGVSYWILSH